MSATAEQAPTFEAAKAEVAAWMRERARDEDDLRAGSRLLARFVAAAVRRDRATRKIAAGMADILGRLNRLVDDATPGRQGGPRA